MANIDYDFFEDNGFGDNDKIVEMLRKKNNKVRQIFREDSVEEVGNRQSHGIRLISINSESAIPRPSSDKENVRSSSQHMQALSPKSIHEALPEDINDFRSKPSAKSTPRPSLRQSLFKSQVNSVLACSTPFIAHRRSEQTEDSFNQLDLSPIKSSAKVIVEPAAGTSKRISNLAPIEKNLREQYQVDDEPRRKEKSSSSDASGKKFFQRRTSTHSSTSQRTKVSGIAMEMSEDPIRTSQPSKNVSKNKTDMRTTGVNETSIMSQKNRQIGDHQELIRRLQAIENSNEMTSDEDETPKAATPKKDKSKQKSVEPVANIDLTLDEDDIELPATEPIEQEVFRKPQTPKNSEVSDTSAQNSSLKKVVAENIIESIRSLRPTMMGRNETEQSIASVTSNTQMSYQLNIPSKKKSSQSKVANEKVNEYLALTNRKKTKSDQTKKRTLYSQSPDSSVGGPSCQDRPTTSSAPDSDANTFARPKSVTNMITPKSSRKVNVQNNKQVESSESEEEEVQEQIQKKPQKKIKDKVQDDNERAPKKGKEKNKNVPHAESEIGSEEELQAPDRLLPESSAPNVDNEKPQKKSRGRTKKQKSPVREQSESEEESQEPEPPKNSRGNSKKQKKQKSPVRQEESESEDEEEVSAQSSRRESSQNRQEEISTQQSQQRRSSVTQDDSESEESRQFPMRQRSSNQQESSEEESEDEASARASHRNSSPQRSSVQQQSESEEESEEEASARGSQRSSRPQRSSGQQYQSESEEEASARTSYRNSSPQRSPVHQQTESDEEPSPEKVPERPKKSRKRTKRRSSIPEDNQEVAELPEQELERKEKKRKSLKRKKPDNFDDQPSQRRRKRIIIQNDDSDSESEDANESKEYDVLYVPDNDRYQLRKRRMIKPSWNLKTAASNMRITYGVMTNKDIKEEQRLNALARQYKVTIAQVCHSMGYSNAFRPPASEIRKGLLKFVKDRRIRMKEKQLLRGNADGASARSEQTSLKSFAPSEAIQFAFDTMSKQTSHTNGSVEINEAFDFAQLDGIEWVSVGSGVEYHAFLNAQGDGLLKVLPGAVKKKSRTRNSILKFTVLCGDVTFIINGIEKNIKGFGYVMIRRQQNYEIQNRGEKEAIINFIKHSTDEN